MKTKIVLLGSGYTCVWAYKYLMKNLSEKEQSNIEITLISASDHHAFHGFTGEFLTGVLPINLRETPNEALFPEAKIIKGKVLSINQLKKIVSYKNENTNNIETYSYNHVVIGMGAVDNTDLIPGLYDFTESVKAEMGIENIRKKLIKLISSPRKSNEKFNFVIGGAGLAGVELCANFCEYLGKLSNDFPILKECGYSVHLVHSGERILPQLQGKFEDLIKYTQRQLEKYGVIVHTKNRINQFEKNGLWLESGTYLPADIMISTLGQKVCAPESEVAFETDVQGRIVGNKFLNAKGFENVWIGGDVAAIPHVSGKYDCRADALWAIKHGTWIGRNIANTLKNKPLRRFTFYGLGQTASLGMNKAFSELYGIQIKGALAWWIRFGFFLYFMPKRSYSMAAFKAFFLQKNFAFEKEKSENTNSFSLNEIDFIPNQISNPVT